MHADETTSPPPIGVVSDALDEFSRGAGLTPMDESGAVPVRLAGEIVETARHLGQVVSRRDLFSQNDEMVWFDWQGERRTMDPLRFRTWVRDRAGCIVYQKRDKEDRPIPETLTKDAAATILASETFKKCVRPLTAMNSVPLPVLRPGGKLELLQPGYDDETGIFTLDTGIKVDTTMDIASAKANFRRMFQGFPITDERSWSVLLAGFLALFVRHLPGGGGLRPGILALANKPGSGKSVICKALQYPVLGRAPTVKMKQGEQLDKELEAMMIAAKPVLFFDNVYGGLFSASIDALLTSEEQEGRAMGGHGTFRARNSALLIVSGNRLEANEDAIRRFLVIDLFEKGDPKERVVPRDELLHDEVMKRKEWREMALSICYAFVRHWHEMSRPEGSITFQTFEPFSWLMGGIVEAAGYGSPFVPPEIPDALNPDAQEFRDLLEEVLAEMGAESQKDFTLQDLARLARSRQIYEPQVGTQDDGRRLTIRQDKLSGQDVAYAQDLGYMTEKQLSGFGKKMKKQAGTEAKVKGHTVKFGKRAQSRRTTYTVSICGSGEN
jgi:hypothetical protein